jgi:hypothetical protein
MGIYTETLTCGCLVEICTFEIPSPLHFMPNKKRKDGKEDKIRNTTTK